MWLPLMSPLLGTWPATQACALIGNRTSGPLVRRPTLTPLSHTSQGPFSILFVFFWKVSVNRHYRIFLVLQMLLELMVIVQGGGKWFTVVGMESTTIINK